MRYNGTPLKMRHKSRGGSRISEKEVPMYKGVGFALLVLSIFFLKYPMEMNS